MSLVGNTPPQYNNTDRQKLLMCVIHGLITIPLGTLMPTSHLLRVGDYRSPLTNNHARTKGVNAYDLYQLRYSLISKHMVHCHKFKTLYYGCNPFLPLVEGLGYWEWSKFIGGRRRTVFCPIGSTQQSFYQPPSVRWYIKLLILMHLKLLDVRIKNPTHTWG